MAAPIETAAVVGAGVIGSAWAARFALHGVDVSVVDPNPDTARIIDEVFANARAAWGDLELPPTNEGTVTIVDSIAEAVTAADHVQESAPENLDVKRGIPCRDRSARPARHGDRVINLGDQTHRPSSLLGSPGASACRSSVQSRCTCCRWWRFAAENRPQCRRLLRLWKPIRRSP